MVVPKEISDVSGSHPDSCEPFLITRVKNGDATSDLFTEFMQKMMILRVP
jgi:hypothetical protein